MQDYMEECRELNSPLDRLIKTGDRQTDTHTDRHTHTQLWNLEVLTHLKIEVSLNVRGVSCPHPVCTGTVLSIVRVYLEMKCVGRGSASFTSFN